ncbi:SPOR domain-containing protein [Aquicella lusitana]|uniref:Sporulation related protein n=1 Tax=Aquicella lusitana TaxID=254246 RepID=A0A370GEZ6_9COXI|nr:SPOR domain-containing protein [Aquicella lusitana]RDI41679.1 sporulation related protein [Aquicella lusitana]VVC72655.1 hypothetical protein AQULUS_03690 [Aquicella lusitana]
MRRDAAKKNPRKEPPLKRWAVFASVFAILGCCVAYFAYQHIRANAGFSEGAVYFSQIKNWFGERKSRLRQDIAKAKQLVKNREKPAEPTIHFEFYTALPNMQVTVSEPADKAEKSKNEIKMASKRHPAFLNADELEREFAKEIRQTAYVIQVGVFKSAASAERYRQSLAVAGFSPSVVKLNEKETYRVQLGPFSSKDQVSLAKQKLQKKGVTGLVRQIAAG